MTSTGTCAEPHGQGGNHEQQMHITPLTGKIGALVEGVYLGDLDEAGFAALHRALLEHHVLFVRDQHLGDTEHLALAQRWGTPMPNPIAQLHGNEQVLNPVENTAERPPSADQFHTDLTYWAEPPNVAILCALDIPAVGGDTLWASLYDVYDSLSEPMKNLCQELRAWHKPSEHFIQANVQLYGVEAEHTIRENCQGAILPLVRTHDETGRQALFSSSFIDHILDVHPAESDMLLRYVENLIDDPNRTVRWRWRAGDVAIWDERCTNHRALADYYPQYRLMRRCTAGANRPFYRPDGAQKPMFVGEFA